MRLLDQRKVLAVALVNENTELSRTAFNTVTAARLLILIHSRKSYSSVEVCNSMKAREDDMQTFNSYYSLSVFLNLCVVTSPQQTRQHFSLVTWATGNPLVNERFTVPIFLGKGHNVLWYGRGCWDTK